MIKTIFAGIITCLITSASGQQIFQKLYGLPGSYDVGNGIVQLQDSGFVILGNSRKNLGGADFDCTLIRLDKAGNKIWSKAYGRNGHDYCLSLLTLQSGNMLFAGFSQDSASVLHDQYLIQVDANGGILNSIIIGSDSLRDIFSDCFPGNSKIVCSGFANQLSIPYLSNGSVTLFDENLNIIWSRLYSFWLYLNISSGASDSQGSLYFTGSANNDGFQSHTDDCIVFKTDTLGNVIWGRRFSTPEFEFGSAVFPVPNGVIIAGQGQGFTGPLNRHPFLMKLDTAGNLQWFKYYTTPGWGFYVFSKSHDGGVLISGDEGFIIRTDSMGNVQQISRQTLCVINSLVEMHDKGIAATGIASTNGSQDEEIFFLKTDSNWNGGCYQMSAWSSAISFNATLHAISITSKPSQLPVRSGGINKPFPAVLNTRCETATGITQPKETETRMKIVPNPVSDRIIIMVADSEKERDDLNAVIFDTSGRVVLKSPFIPGTDWEIDAGALSNCIYHIRISGRHGIIHAQHILINNQ
jgi:hypothetical protein